MDTGVARLIYVLARGLDELGHEVHLLHAVDRVDTEILCRLRALAGVRCTAIDMKRRLQLSDLGAGLALRRYLSRNGPFDIVHGHSSKAGALARLFCIGLPGIRLYTPHAFYTLAPNLPRAARLTYGAAERLLAFFCAKIICSSDLERRHASSLGIASSRLEVITNAIDPPVLAEADRTRFDLPDDASVLVGFVGRLEYQKAPDVLLRAIARAAESNHGIYLIVIGCGSMEPALVRQAADLGIAHRIRWLGKQSIYRYLASFDILAMPSRYEGFSLIPLDAMHAGLPIVCTPVGGIEECVSDGETGLIVAADDHEAFATALLSLANCPDRLRSMGVAARARAPLFAVEDMVSATERLYLAAMARGSAAGIPLTRELIPAPADMIVGEHVH